VRGRIDDVSEKLKICMLGATGVGKTSLVDRFVRSIFSDRYRTTIGVKIEVRQVQRPNRAVDLVLWDLSGEDEFQSVRLSYLRGAAGYLLVIDGTRRESVATAVTLHAAARSAIGDVPFIAVLNKDDLVAEWDVDARDLDVLARAGWTILRTSAKTGKGVAEVFDALVDAIPPVDASMQDRPAV
jgi:small GTP-binding protein